MGTSVTATGITFPDATVQTTAASGSSFPTTYNSIGSYVVGYSNVSSIASGDTIAAGSGTSQLQAYKAQGGCGPGFTNVNNLSGTWRCMYGGASSTQVYNTPNLFIRIA